MVFDFSQPYPSLREIRSFLNDVGITDSEIADYWVELEKQGIDIYSETGRKKLYEHFCGNEREDMPENVQDKFKRYSGISEEEKKIVEKNSPQIRKLFENIRIRDFIFEPFKGVFKDNADNPDEIIMSTITQVAIANAVLAGLPGKLGIGVAVSVCFEAWMAFKIAKSVGFDVKSINDIWKYIGLLGGVLVSIVWLFKIVLNFAFGIFNMVGALPATILAELVTTDIIGVLFWFGFIEAKESGSFRIPKRMLWTIKGRVVDLFNHQKIFVAALAKPENIRLMYDRLKWWFSGDLALVSPVLKGELFSFAAMASLISGRYEELDGPLGKVFIESIRRGFSDKLGDATLDEMRDYFSVKTPEQLKGAVNLVKGEMFEHLVQNMENADGDSWKAELHEARNIPGSDIVFTNIETGEQIEVSLKATDIPNTIEKALERYPDIPILTTEEIEKYYGNHPLIDYTNISDVELEKITEGNFDRLVQKLEPISAVNVAVSGVVSKAIGSIWPFVMAYLRKKITPEQFKTAMVKVFGESGVSLTSRISFALILGPVFAWYLLARSVLLMTKSAQKLSNPKTPPKTDNDRPKRKAKQASPEQILTNIRTLPKRVKDIPKGKKKHVSSNICNYCKDSLQNKVKHLCNTCKSLYCRKHYKISAGKCYNCLNL